MEKYESELQRKQIVSQVMEGGLDESTNNAIANRDNGRVLPEVYNTLINK